LVTLEEGPKMSATTDPIADMLTRIRNGVRAHAKSVDVPFSKVKAGILAVMKREGYIADFQSAGEEGAKKLIRVYLKYSDIGEPVIAEIQRASTPGRRVYKGAEAIEPVLRGIGMAVVSTSRGILSDRECRKERLGGEVLCTVW